MLNQQSNVDLMTCSFRLVCQYLLLQDELINQQEILQQPNLLVKTHTGKHVCFLQFAVLRLFALLQDLLFFRVLSAETNDIVTCIHPVDPNLCKHRVTNSHLGEHAGADTSTSAEDE